MSIIKIKKRCNPYVQIDKGCLDDPKISWQAKGMLCYLLSKPEDWKPKVEDLIKRSTDGKKAVYATLQELTDAGYIVKTFTRDNGRIISVDYTVYELPVMMGEEVEKAPFQQTEPLPQNGKVANLKNEPLPHFLQVEKLQVENGTHSNKEEGIRKKKNKKEGCTAFADLVKEELDQLENEFHTTWSKYQEWYTKQNFEYVPKIRDQLTPRQLHTLLQQHTSKIITSKIMVIENGGKKYTKNKSVFLTISNWLEMYPA